MVLAGACLAAPRGEIENRKSKIENPHASYPLRFYQAERFRRAVRAAAKVPPAAAAPGARGVVPHQLPGSPLIARLFAAAARGRHPSVVVVLAPNHRLRGAGRLLVSDHDWETPFGLLRADREMARALDESGAARMGPEPFAAEHSVGVLVPFVQHYLPEARVLPVLLGHPDAPAVRRLVHVLDSLLPPDTLVVASVDFSHYLPRRQSDAKDRETLEWLRAFDLDRLFRARPDHADCPEALVALLLLMQRRGSGRMHVWGHDNSGALAHDDHGPTTGYYCLAFTQ